VAHGLPEAQVQDAAYEEREAAQALVVVVGGEADASQLPQRALGVRDEHEQRKHAPARCEDASQPPAGGDRGVPLVVSPLRMRRWARALRTPWPRPLRLNLA
jgi:hypothetical protein